MKASGVGLRLAAVHCMWMGRGCYIDSRVYCTSSPSLTYPWLHLKQEQGKAGSSGSLGSAPHSQSPHALCQRMTSGATGEEAVQRLHCPVPWCPGSCADCLQDSRIASSSLGSLHACTLRCFNSGSAVSLRAALRSLVTAVPQRR